MLNALFLYISIAMVIIGSSALGADQYAILGYNSENKQWVTEIADYVATRVHARTGAEVISRDSARTVLFNENCNRSLYTSDKEYCKAAGALLAAQHLIYGKVWNEDGIIFVESHIIDSKTGKKLGNALAQSSPSDKLALSKAIDSAVSELVQHTETGHFFDDIVGGSAASMAILLERLKSPTAEMIFDHIEIGLRTSYLGLDESEYHYDAEGVIVDGYLGSITELKGEQNYNPTLYANITYSDWLSLQLGYERYEVRTGRYWDDDTDGSFRFSGPSLILQLRYANQTRFTPYAGAGVAMLNVDFDMIGWWHNGFGGTDALVNYSNWRDSGSPQWPNGGYQRNLKVVDDFVFKPVWQLGCQCRLTEHISLDLDGRYITLDSKLDYTLERYGNVIDDRGTSRFPMESWIVDLGILWCF